jgi:AraC family transcriptional regulator
MQRFKATTLMTPHKFVIQRRISRARRLLAGSNIEHARIALDSGFSDQSHFIATFKRVLGTTPHEYRRRVA